METIENIAQLLLDTVKSIADFGLQVAESVPLVLDSLSWLPGSLLVVISGSISVMVILRIVGRD